MYDKKLHPKIKQFRHAIRLFYKLQICLQQIKITQFSRNNTYGWMQTQN